MGEARVRPGGAEQGHRLGQEVERRHRLRRTSPDPREMPSTLSVQSVRPRVHTVPPDVRRADPPATRGPDPPSRTHLTRPRAIASATSRDTTPYSATTSADRRERRLGLSRRYEAPYDGTRPQHARHHRRAARRSATHRSPRSPGGGSAPPPQRPRSPAAFFRARTPRGSSRAVGTVRMRAAHMTTPTRCSQWYGQRVPTIAALWMTVLSFPPRLAAMTRYLRIRTAAGDALADQDRS